jgi:hypothetical protein
VSKQDLQVAAELVGSDRTSGRFETSDPIANLVPTRERQGHGGEWLKGLMAQALLQSRRNYQKEVCMGRDYRKLEVFHLADDVVTDVYKVTARFSDEERFGIVRQVPADTRAST